MYKPATLPGKYWNQKKAYDLNRDSPTGGYADEQQCLFDEQFRFLGAEFCQNAG
ncbi:hypothetical protein TUM17580_37270 [Citrobacter farmeri]|nr:hypothetical protein TUM17580_37270 [Citrobacter farmeri]